MIASTRTYDRSTIYFVACGILLFWLAVALAEPLLLSSDEASWSLLPYSELTIDKSALNYQPPSWFRTGSKHILGTDELGRDVLAGIIHGAWTSLFLTFWTLLIAIVAGGFLGTVAAYYENDGIKASVVEFLLWGIALTIGAYTIVYAQTSYDVVIGMGLCLMLYVLIRVVGTRLPLRKYVFPIDDMVVGLIQVQESIPALFILVAFVGIFSSYGMWSLVGILAFFYSCIVCKYTRNEAKITKGLSYVQADRVSGFSDIYIMVKSIFFNVFPRLVPILVHAISAIILVEASLSFLGLGLAVEEVTWGKMIASARAAPHAWWMAVFPGLAIFSITYSLHVVSETTRKSV